MTQNEQTHARTGTFVRTGLVVAILASLLGTARPAHACSCSGGGDPRDAIKYSDAAVIGTLTGSRRAGPKPTGPTRPSDPPKVLTFRVDEAIKGDLGESVEVHEPGDTCGIGVTKGRQAGMFLTLRDGEWHSSLCAQIDPEKLREAAAPLPEPDGEGPIEVLVAGSFGEASTLALDDQGRTLGYAYGDHTVLELSICPGSERFVEIYRDFEGRMHLAVRQTSTLEIVWDQELSFLGREEDPPRFLGARCLSPEAEDVAVLSTDEDWPVAESYLWLIHEDSIELLYSGSAREGRFVDDRLYMREGRKGKALTYFDLESRERVRIGVIPKQAELFVSPDHTRLAYVRGVYHSKLVVLDVSVDPFIIRKQGIGGGKEGGEVVWLDDHTLAVLGGFDLYEIEIYDDELNLIRAVPGTWFTNGNSYLEGEAWGVDYGNLYHADLPDGRAEVLRKFFSQATYAIAALPDEIFIEEAP